MNALGRIFLILITFFSGSSLRAQIIQDIDGNSYTAITIGSQVWLQENLQTTRFSNGDSIPSIIGPTVNDTNAIYQWAYNDDTFNLNNYARLYTWNVARDSRGVCPLGWHVPIDAEWDSLIQFLGGSAVAGNALKDTGTQYWNQSSNTVTNSSSFSARGAGFRGNPEGFKQIKESSHFWSATAFGGLNFPRGMKYSVFADKADLLQGAAVGNFGACIRCLKDQALTRATIPLDERKWELYPNPNQGNFTLETEEIKNFDIHLYNSQGQEIYSAKKLSSAQIEVSRELKKGLYFLLILEKDQWTKKQFLVE